jgi:hypothetical protein
MREPYPNLSTRERLFMLQMEHSAAVRCELWPGPRRDPAADSYLQWKRENGANDWPGGVSNA